MSKQITDYGIFSPPGEDGDRYNICGLIAGTMDYVTFGPAFPESEIQDAMKTIDSLVERHGLPVDAETIMQHFNRELLPETENKGLIMDEIKILRDALRKRSGGSGSPSLR